MKRAKYVLLILVAIVLTVIFIGIQLIKNEGSQKQNKSSQDLNARDSLKVHNVIRDKISSKNSKLKDSVFVHTADMDTILSNWKTYTNNQYGFTFQYPSTWSKFGDENNVADRMGNIVAIEVNFIDSLSNTTLLVSYHLPPNGVELYRYAVSQYESSQGWYVKGGKMIKIAGNKAVKVNTEMIVGGRGTKLNPPLRLILVDFLDKKQTGEIQLQFKTPLPDDDIEVAKFERLLSTFEFTN